MTITEIRPTGGPVSSSATLNSYVERMRDSDVLGLITWYSVAECVVPHHDLANLLARHNLEEFTPRKPSDVDVFRRTCTAAQRKRQPTDVDSVYLNVLTRDVSNDDFEVVKRLVLETVDSSGRRLSYDAKYDLIFGKATAKLDVKRLPSSEIGGIADTLADKVAMEIAGNFAKLRGTVDGAAIRGLINKVLVESHATALRPTGGVYFAPKGQAEVIAGLEAMAGFIDGTSVHSVPLPDDRKQREMLQAAFEAEAHAETTALTETVEAFAQILRDGNDISGEKFAAIATRYRKLTEKATAYKETLESDLAQTTTALDVLAMQMAQLAGAMKAA